jgi:fibronectin-binding autotransporter adhesin
MLTWTAYGQSGIWTNRASGNWGTALNWAGGTIADGGDNLADFSTLASGVTSLTVTLDSARTLGNLKFGAATNTYLIGANTLTLQNSTNTPAILPASQTTTLGVPLASSQTVLISGGSIALTNQNNNFSGGLTLQTGQAAFLGQGALGAGTITVGSSVGSGQSGFNMVSTAATGTTPIVITNNFVIQTILWIVGQSGVGFNPQPVVILGNVYLNSGASNLRAFALQLPLTIGGVVSGGGTYGLNLNTLAGGALTLTNPANSFSGNITFNTSQTLQVDSDGALGYFNNKVNFATAGGTLRALASFTMGTAYSRQVVMTAAGTLDSSNNVFEVDCPITGAGALTKAGSGTLNLTGANTFTGGIALNAGTFEVSSGGSLATAVAMTVPTNTVLQFQDSASVPNLASYTINNGGKFYLIGSPTISSTAPITVNSGGLFDVSGLSSAFTLGSGQTLSGNGSVNGGCIAGSSSAIVPGTAGTAGTLTFSSNLSLNGQQIQFDLTNNVVEGGGTNDEILVGGNLTLSGGETILLNYVAGSLATGTYKLIKYNGTLTGTFTLAAAYPNVAIDNGVGTPGYITLVVSGPAVANNLFWKGDGTANLWNISAVNWVTNFANPALAYSDPSKVTFDDLGSSSPAVNLTTTVLPNLVTFNTTNKSYIIAGAGKISGSTGLTKNGTNTVILDSSTPNDFSGPIAINAGTLQIGNNDTGGSIGAGNITGASATTATLAYNRTDATTLNNKISTSLIQVNSGTLSLAGSQNNNSDVLTVNNGGMVILGKTSASSVNAIGAGPTTINAGGTVQLGGTGGSQISSTGVVNMNGGTFDPAGLTDGFTSLNGYGTLMDSVGGGTLTLSAASGLKPQNGTLTDNNVNLTLSGTPGFQVQSGGTFNLAGGTVSYGSSTTAGVNAGGVFNMSGGSLSTSTYFAIGSSTTPAVANFSGGSFVNTGELLQGFGGTAVVSFSGSANLNLNDFSYGNSPLTNYFNGGTVTTKVMHQRGGGTWTAFFNGGTLQAKASVAFMPDTGTLFANQNTYISTNGLYFNDGGYAVSIAQPLLHDPALGAAPDGGLTKSGSGTLTLTGVNTFTGGITNLGGFLGFNTRGGVNGNNFIADYATNIITVAASGTTITNQSLALGSSGVATEGLNFNLGTLGLPTAPPLKVAGALTSVGNVSVGLVAPVLPPGSATLIKYGSFNPAQFANWSVSTIPYVTVTLSNNTANSSIDINVAPGNYPLWTAANGNVWDTSTINWKMSLTSVATNYFETAPPGPPVAFDDTAASHDVQLTAQTVSPAFITVSNTVGYTFEGGYGIAGSGALIKTGTGSLVLSNASGANTYSGSTLVTGGSLVAAMPNMLSTASALTVTGGSLNVSSNNQTIGNVTLNNSTLLGTGTLTGNGGTLTFNDGINNFILGMPLAGTIQIVQNGTGEITLTNASTYLGNFSINSGTVRVQNGAALGYGAFTGSSLTSVSSGARLILDGTFTTTEELYLDGSGPDGNGALVVTNGNVTYSDNAKLGGTTTIYIAGNASLTNTGQFYGGGPLIKTGPGLLYCGSAVPLSGATASQGTLIVTQGLGSGSGTLTVNSGATFGGAGTIVPNTTIQAGGTLAPGALGIGTITFNNLTSAGAINMEISNNGGVLTADQIVINTNLVLTGTLTVTDIGPSPQVAGNSFTLFATNYPALSAITPVLPTLPAGLTWTNRLAIDGTIAVLSSGTATNPTNITTVVRSGNLELTWPADHTGWTLQTQTNALSVGLGTNWVAVPGSSTVNSITNAINPANGSVFYRLVYP